MFEIADWPLFLQVFAAVGVLLYGIVLVRFIPQRYAWPFNIATSVATIALCLWLGLSLDSIGLSVDTLLRGFIIGLITSSLIISAVYLVAQIPLLNRFFTDTPFARMSRRRLGTEVAMRIPLSTALLEEVLFRGVLLGLFLQFHDTVVALLLMSICFGLWHIAGEVRRLETQHTARPLLRTANGQQWATIVGIVAATGAAGFVFGVLRIWSGSLLAPWLVHWAINASGALASRVPVTKKSRSV